MSDAVLAELTKIGLENDIAPLRWHVLSIADELILEGTPANASPDTCGEWARALGMTRYEVESREGFESWYLNDGPWSLEISHQGPSDG